MIEGSSATIIGDQVVIGEAGRQLGHPAVGKMAAHQGERGTVPFAQLPTCRMTSERTKKIHWQPGGAPVMPRPVDTPPAAGPLGRELAHEETGAVIHLCCLAWPAGQCPVGVEHVETGGP